uniref:ShKT domain-containing protein n=1 Tax=Caenorhabditis japonica TaxID=281687 RepID=A0A8R1DEN7_CAEJA
MRLLLLILFSLSAIILPTASRFFDVCPGRRQSIGACLVGLCPAGSECINSYCCKNKKSNSASPLDLIEVDTDETSEFESCPDGKKSIGECISHSCPLGYQCSTGLCCEKENFGLKKWSLKSRKEEEVPMKASPISLITESPEKEVETKKEKEEKDIEDSEEQNSTFAPDKEIVDEEDSELEEEEEAFPSSTSTTTTTSTTTKAPTTTSEYKKKTKRIKAKKPKSTRTTTTTTTQFPTTVTLEEETTTPEIEENTESDTLPPPIEETTEPHFVCPVGAPIGECIANKCPEGHGCVEGQCCILTPQINCTDTLAGCLPHLCDRKGYRQFMTTNCPKTCARCHLVNITSNELHDCRDRRTDCEEWAAEGFCESSLYTTRQKIKFCGKSCKLC